VGETPRVQPRPNGRRVWQRRAVTGAQGAVAGAQGAVAGAPLRFRLGRTGVGWRWEWQRVPQPEQPGMLRRQLGGAERYQWAMPRGLEVTLVGPQERRMVAPKIQEERCREFVQRLRRVRPWNPYTHHGMRRRGVTLPPKKAVNTKGRS
jgi:hypothetical protein